MHVRWLKLVVAMLGIAGLSVFITGCESNTDNPAPADTNVTVTATNFAAANLEGVWNLVVTGTVRSVTGALVLDAHGNVTGLTGPAAASGIVGHYSLASGSTVSGSLKYSSMGTNGFSENHTIYMQGHFINLNQISGSQTHSWMPAFDGGYDTGTFTLTK